MDLLPEFKMSKEDLKLVEINEIVGIMERLCDLTSKLPSTRAETVWKVVGDLANYIEYTLEQKKRAHLVVGSVAEQTSLKRS